MDKWATDAKLDKHITWHCARHSFWVLLQQKGIDLATAAGMLGHTMGALDYLAKPSSYEEYVQVAADIKRKARL